jgi:hypothetical protein
VYFPLSVALSFLSVFPVCLAEVLGGVQAWLLPCGCPVGFFAFTFGLSGLGFGCQPQVVRASFWVLWLSALRGYHPFCVAGRLFSVGCCRAGGVGVLVVVRHCGAAGFCGAGQNALSSMPNKSVKGTARRSGWQSWFFITGNRLRCRQPRGQPLTVTLDPTNEILH